MKTSQAYYHKGLFLFSEKGWPERKKFDFLIDYNKALSLALEESVPFEDQEAIKKMIWLNESGFYSCCNSRRACLSDFNACIGTVKEGLYTFPEVEGEIDQCEKPCSDKCMNLGHCGQSVFRIKPSIPSPQTHYGDVCGHCGHIVSPTSFGLRCEKCQPHFFNGQAPSLKPMTLEEAKDQVARDISLKTSQLYLLKVVTSWDEWIKEHKPSSEFIAQANLLAATLWNQSLIEEVERLKASDRDKQKKILYAESQAQKLLMESNKLYEELKQQKAENKQLRELLNVDRDTLNSGQKMLDTAAAEIKKMAKQNTKQRELLEQANSEAWGLKKDKDRAFKLLEDIFYGRVKSEDLKQKIDDILNLPF